MSFKLSAFKTELTSEEKEHMETIVEHLFASNTREFKLEKAGTPFGESWSVRQLFEDILPEEDVDHNSHYCVKELEFPNGTEHIKLAREMNELAITFHKEREETYIDMIYKLLGEGFVSSLKPNFPYHKEMCIIVARGKVTFVLT